MTDSEDQIEKDKKQLEELQHEIDQVRKETAPHEEGPTFVDSGDIGEEYDDQTIAPPG